MNIRNELTLYFYPSPGLNWKTPGTLAKTAVINSLFSRRSIGHVSVELRVEGKRRFMTGMRQIGKNRQSAELLLVKQQGLGILFHDFSGRLETESELAAELELRFETGKLSFLTCAISDEAVRRLEQYLREYQDKGCSGHYGLPNRPLYGEGGGCSAFGVSFLETAGILSPAYAENWTRVIRVPLKFMGGARTGKRVSLLSVLRCRNWGSEAEPFEPVFFWDPDLMHDWVVKTWSLGTDVAPYEKAQKGKAVGLLRDCTSVPVPLDPIWRHL